MQKLLKTLVTDYPELNFIRGDQFRWAPTDQAIIYTEEGSDRAIWALFHELAHALLEHKSYSSDIELLLMEVECWDKAKEIARSYDQEIDDNHIQDCLDTYRDWLDQRSTCPACGNKSLQENEREYRCFNCQMTWEVTTSRFCRPYRKPVTRSATALRSKNKEAGSSSSKTPASVSFR